MLPVDARAALVKLVALRYRRIAERFVKFHHEIIAEIFRHSAIVLGRISYDTSLVGLYLYRRPVVERVDYYICLVGLRKREPEYSGTLCRSKLRCHIIIGEVDTIIIGRGGLGFVRHPACSLVLVNSLFPCQRCHHKLAVVINPRARLMRLLEPTQLRGIVIIGPTIAHLTRHRRPEIHPPRPGYRRIRVSCR